MRIFIPRPTAHLTDDERSAISRGEYTRGAVDLPFYKGLGYLLNSVSFSHQVAAIQSYVAMTTNKPAPSNQPRDCIPAGGFFNPFAGEQPADYFLDPTHQVWVRRDADPTTATSRPGWVKLSSTGCQHKWSRYEGLTQVYDFCEQCDEKRNV